MASVFKAQRSVSIHRASFRESKLTEAVKLLFKSSLTANHRRLKGLVVGMLNHTRQIKFIELSEFVLDEQFLLSLGTSIKFTELCLRHDRLKQVKG